MELTREAKIKILEGTLEVLGPRGERWIKHNYQDGGSFCLVGAVGQAAANAGVAPLEEDGEFGYPDLLIDGVYQDFDDGSEVLARAVSIHQLAKDKGFDSAPAFNDDDDTVWGDVEKFVKERLAQLRAEATEDK
jgi:hypothetical protein